LKTRKKRITLVTMSKINKKQKLAQARRAVERAKISTAPDFERLVENLISPSTAEPMVFPSPVPGRAGTAKFPLVIEHSGDTDFGIRVEPSFENPLQISHGASIPESNSVGYIAFTTGYGESVSETISLEGSRGCKTYGEVVAGRVAAPMSSAAGATLNIALQVLQLDTVAHLRIVAYDGANWVTLTQFNDVVVGKTPSIGAIAWLNTYTHISFEFLNSAGGSVPNTNVAGMASIAIQLTAGTYTCASTDVESVMDVFTPQWSSLLAAVERARVVACECLVTYMGSTLDNSGSIAVCNTDEDLAITSNFYDTIASRPIDMYEGRLSSQGESEGGAHWHYLPDAVESLELKPLGTRQMNEMVGYFGIKGMKSTEPVRIHCTFIVNYYSSNVAFAPMMKYQPSYGPYSRMIRLLREDVPLVSSNDSHLNKLLKSAKRAAKSGVAYAIENPEQVLAALENILLLL
jgi:hypothetical protein